MSADSDTTTKSMSSEAYLSIRRNQVKYNYNGPLKAVIFTSLGRYGG